MNGDSSTSGTVVALLDHLDGAALSDEDRSIWRDAIRKLEAKGPKRDRLDAFAKVLGLEQGKAGRPRKVLPYPERVRRAVAFSRVQQRPGNERREKALESSAAELHVEVDELEAWLRDPKTREFARTGLPALRASFVNSAACSSEAAAGFSAGMSFPGEPSADG